MRYLQMMSVMISCFQFCSLNFILHTTAGVLSLICKTILLPLGLQLPVAAVTDRFYPSSSAEDTLPCRVQLHSHLEAFWLP